MWVDTTAEDARRRWEDSFRMLQRPHVHFRRSSRLKDSARVGICCLSVSLPLASLDLQGESENFLSILAYSTSLACSDESSIQASHSGSGLSLIEKIALLIIIIIATITETAIFPPGRSQRGQPFWFDETKTNRISSDGIKYHRVDRRGGHSHGLARPVS